jgi:hypothetical protein
LDRRDGGRGGGGRSDIWQEVLDWLPISGFLSGFHLVCISCSHLFFRFILFGRAHMAGWISWVYPGTSFMPTRPV